MAQRSTTEEVLVRRAPILRSLLDEPKDKARLRQSVPVSRSTINRGLRELESRGFVEPGDGEYRPTLAGRIAYESVDEYTSRLAGIDATTDLLGELDHVTPFSPAVLSGVEVVRPDQTAPDRPFERVAAYVEAADEIRGVISAASERYVALYADRIEEGMGLAAVLTPTVTSRLASEYVEQAGRIFGAETTAFRELGDRLPFGVTLGDHPDGTTLCVTIYGDYGVAGVLLNDSAGAVDWGESVFRDAWDRATPLPDP